MRFLWWRRPRDKASIPEKNSPKDLATLIKEYRSQQFLMSLYKEKFGDVTEYELRRLKEIEEQIIELLPDNLQKDVFHILARHKFDLTRFIEKANWQEIFQEVCRDICHFLYYGTPYPIKSDREPLPFSGNEFFFWLLTQAKIGRKENRLENILAALFDAKEKGMILKHSFNEKELSWIFHSIIVVFMGEWTKQSAVLIDILCELEGGESFIRGLLGLNNDS